MQVTVLIKLMVCILFSFLMSAPKFDLSISAQGDFQVYIFSKSKVILTDGIGILFQLAPPNDNKPVTYGEEHAVWIIGQAAFHQTLVIHWLLLFHLRAPNVH